MTGPTLRSLETWSPRARRRLPWLAPAVATAGVALVAALPHAFAADPHPRLPVRTAQQLVAMVDASHVNALSGTVTSTPRLGLPQLPGSDGGDELTTFLTETTTWQLWVDGSQRQRLALLGANGETDLIHNDSSVWTWNSASQSATHYLIDDGGATTERQSPAEVSASPATEAANLLRHLNPSTAVTVGPTARVAGRPAYSLVLSPRTSATLIGEAVIDVDSATGVPLGVQLFGRGESDAAFSEQFSQVSLSAPDASEFDFTPPPGASVTTHHEGSKQSTGAGHSEGPHVRVIGKGWAGVVEYSEGRGSGPDGLDTTPSSPDARGGRHSLSAILQDATNPTPEGRVLQTRIISVLFTRNGTILAGAVPASRLESLATSSDTQ